MKRVFLLFVVQLLSNQILSTMGSGKHYKIGLLKESVQFFDEFVMVE